MDKPKIQAEFQEAFQADRTIPGQWISFARVAGGVSFLGGMLSLFLSLFTVLTSGDEGAFLILVVSIATIFQGAIVLLIAEIGAVVRDNSRILRRIAAGVVRDTV